MLRYFWGHTIDIVVGVKISVGISNFRMEIQAWEKGSKGYRGRRALLLVTSLYAGRGAISTTVDGCREVS